MHGGWGSPLSTPGPMGVGTKAPNRKPLPKSIASLERARTSLESLKKPNKNIRGAKIIHSLILSCSENELVA